MLRKSLLLVTGLLVTAGAGSVAAQTTLLPVYYAPYRSFEKYEFGATLSFPNYDGLGLEGLFGFGYNQFDLEVRGGFVDYGEGVDTRGTLGATGRYQVVRHSEKFPMDGAVIAGLGAHLFEGSTLLIPFGLSLGRRLNLEDSEISIVPYVQPAGVIYTAGPDHFFFGFGIGADFKLSRYFDARLSVAFGDDPVDGFAISAVWVH